MNMRLIRVPEASKRLGIGSWMVYQLIRQGDLKTVKLGKRRLINTRALDEFINSMEQ